MKTALSYDEIASVLQSIATKEGAVCERFYQNNPDAGSKRAEEYIAAYAALLQALFAFQEIMGIKTKEED